MSDQAPRRVQGNPEGSPERKHMGEIPFPQDTTSGHLRNALQTINLLEYESGTLPLPLTSIRARVEAALGQVERLREEARVHPFSFARHVAETL